jgi:peptidoglycan/LPS O-acetylase OafA/YrhL
LAKKSVSIAERFEQASGHPTGFDYLRIILALGVIVWHSFGLSYGIRYAEKLAASPYGMLEAPIVPMFFALSGFLVAGSLARNSIPVYLGLRALRIIPALATEVCLSALLLGPLLTSDHLRQYFADRKFDSYFLNILADIHYRLPGVFQHNPYPDIVNGQLWTVPLESKCYIVLTVLAVLGIAKRRYFFLLSTVAASIFLWELHLHRDLPADHAPLFVGFLAGVAIFQFRDVIAWDWRIAAVSLVAMVLCFWVPNGVYLAGFPTAYLTVYLGMMNLPKTVLIKGADYSYGLYLYGFVIQQAIARIFLWSHHWYWNLALAIPGTALFATFSWTFVEKPALRLRQILPQVTKLTTAVPQRAAT